MEIWGRWLLGEKASEKFVLRYAGEASRFEAETTVPQGVNEVTLQILAADEVGNFGRHTLTFRISP